MDKTASYSYPAGPPPPSYSGPPPPAPPGAYGVPYEKGPSPYDPWQQLSGYPPASFPAPSAGQQQTLHIYSSSSGGQILGSDKSTILYTWHRSCRSKPHVKLYAGSSSSSQPIGTATFHNWSCRVDVVLHGCAITAKSNGTFKSGHHMPLLATPGGGQGGSLRWKDRGCFSSKKDCTDDAGRTLAEFDRSTWAASKAGKLHLFGEAAAGAAALRDEILLSALVEIEVDQRNSSAAAASAGGGGGGA